MDDPTFKPSSCKIQKYGNLKCNGKDVKVEINGEVPTSGTITLENGKIEEIKLKYENDKTIVYNENKKLIYALPEPYRESENIEVPDLYNNTLTPVIYDGDNWVIADVTEKWYDYSNQKWANAVILDSSVKKDIGDTITVDGTSPDALAMFVWIPRYEYKIEGTYGKGGISKTTPGEIEVNFINKDTKEATELYYGRWEIEKAFDIIKNKVKIENFTSHKVIGVEQDFYAQMLLYNMLEDVKIDPNEIEQNQKDLKYEYKVNMNIMVGIFREKFMEIIISPIEKLDKKIDEFNNEIKKYLVPIKPGRTYPRKKMHSMNKYRHNLRKNC